MTSYWPCRATYDYEKKLYNDHLESLQVMEKNYITMARELEKLRAELTNTASLERRHGTLACLYFTFCWIILSFSNFPLSTTDIWRLHVGGPYGTTQNNEIEASGNPAGQNTYEDGYGVAQVSHIFHFLVFMSWYVWICSTLFLYVSYYFDLKGETPFDGLWGLFPIHVLSRLSFESWSESPWFWDPFVEMVQKCSSFWCEAFFSRRSRLVLIQPILSSLF